MVKFLLKYGSSLYSKDHKGRTAEDVSGESGHLHVQEYLQQERLSACGQLIYYDEIHIWIGNIVSLDTLILR